MKVVILYRPNSEHARAVEEFIHDFKRQEANRQVDVLNVDTVEGITAAKLYDVVQYPAIIALTNDGQLLKAWQGEQLPLMNELAYYASS